MMDKIKKQIDNNKNDKGVYKEYIESFVTTDKVKELYGDTDEFKSLLGTTSKDDNSDKNEEDEFF